MINHKFVILCCSSGFSLKGAPLDKYLSYLGNKYGESKSLTSSL